MTKLKRVRSLGILPTRTSKVIDTEGEYRSERRKQPSETPGSDIQ